MHSRSSALTAPPPAYFAETSRFRERDHVRALMQLRCGSAPFVACATLRRLRGDQPVSCTCCPRDTVPSPPPETAHHILYECPAFAQHRAEERYRPLFATTPAGAHVRPLADHPDQFLLAEFIHYIFWNYDRKTSRPRPWFRDDAEY